jgi:hypothetical protein
MKKKKKTKKQLVQEQKEKLRIAQGAVVIAIILIVGIFVTNLKADTITHKFKSPSFNGVGTSSHYLTIENSTLARFMRNLESRVYAELSRQLVNNLFGETPSTEGTITLEGNTIEYTSDGVTLTLKITEADGTVTEITIPIGTFTF